MFTSMNEKPYKNEKRRQHRSDRSRGYRNSNKQGHKQTHKKETKKDKEKFIVGIIPARMGSSRFPGKPLAKLGDKAMIYHVYHRAKLCPALEKVYIATPDQKICSY